ncbi:MAG: 5-aminolevulic acid synthase, partial [Pseudomonadota bacterium]
YSSIAYAPGEGLVGKGLQGAFNHHTPAAADRAALRACTAEKSRGSGACRIAARVLPRGYSARPLSLSSAATSAFSANYQRQRAPKALAISPSTGAWGIGAGDQAAVVACRRGGARDCEIAIRN